MSVLGANSGSIFANDASVGTIAFLNPTKHKQEHTYRNGRIINNGYLLMSEDS